MLQSACPEGDTMHFFNFIWRTFSEHSNLIYFLEVTKMAMTTRKNASVKALQSVMASEKKHNEQIFIEWLMSCNTNDKRGHIFDQNELINLYGRDNWSQGQGATKTCHLTCHNGNDFQYIVVKRHQTGGYMPEIRNKYGTGNQLIDEINCWNRYAEKPESDYLCPILKFFTSKSDRVGAKSETMQKNVVIIAQKAIYVGNCERACRKAEALNYEHGYYSVNANERYEEMRTFANSQNWRDVLQNGGNSGVIFDYAKQCYKAVFIDYAL